MRTFEIVDYLLTGLGILALASLFACSTPAPAPTNCPGFEKVTTGSGCRDTATGEFAPVEKCSC